VVVSICTLFIKVCKLSNKLETAQFTGPTFVGSFKGTSGAGLGSGKVVSGKPPVFL
jgi:hypothetical protein